MQIAFGRVRRKSRIVADDTDFADGCVLLLYGLGNPAPTIYCNLYDTDRTQTPYDARCADTRQDR